MIKTSQRFKEYRYRIERCQTPSELQSIVKSMTEESFPHGEKIALFLAASAAAQYFDAQIKKGVVYLDGDNNA